MNTINKAAIKLSVSQQILHGYDAALVSEVGWVPPWGEIHELERALGFTHHHLEGLERALGYTHHHLDCVGEMNQLFRQWEEKKDLMKQFCLCVIYSEENHRVKNLVTGHTPTNGCCEKIRSEDCCAYDLSPRANRHVHILGLQKL